MPCGKISSKSSDISSEQLDALDVLRQLVVVARRLGVPADQVATTFKPVLERAGVGVRRALRGEVSWARVAGMLAWDAAYLLLYPALFSWVNTLLPMLGLWGELRECVLLLAAWMLPAALLLLWPARRLSRRNAAALPEYLSS